MDARPDDDAGADGTNGAHGAPGTPGGTPDEQQAAADEGTAARSDDRPASHPDPAPAPGDDEVWASIVARLSDVGTDPEPPPERRVLRRATDDDVPDAADDVPAVVPVGRDWDGTSQYDTAEDAVDDLEHFVPADPGPVLGGDPLLTLAWCATAGVPLFMLVVVVAWQDAPTILVRTAAVVFVVAVAVLVWRMPQRREPSDDDGAVV
ncbi:hypothetical protein [Cellulomonas wangsupingiae]|uniref:DUF3040 domain-containing protein n=1 Tax=Cellulomonas wangsupingiae TaxID=2968085 RepID=A0ABY5JZN9_9CELL|nr:hypothetical protein [Cellulomonas wangsupingiae]MCC2333472.1 hypothetical protein [Cellulomonas wangsupingiae]MCM0638322.1 hypothetical protein [Cellulomonas wangsupingiae]UUI63657.1 hypothetical protein NP075_10905 [Cellulomonas wangsupingiae]